MENMETHERLKIAVIAFELITPHARTGGVSHFNHRLCTKLSEWGHEITAYTMNNELENASYRIQSLYEQKGQANRISRFYWAPFSARKVDFSAYDLVISSGDDWAMRRQGKPWVRIMHGSAWREVQHNTRMLRKINLSFQYLLERLSFRQSSVTLFNSNDTETLYPARKQDKVLFLPVDTKLFYPGEKASVPTILFVGALDSRKRGRMLRDLFVASIRKRIPDARLWMVCHPGEPLDGVEYFEHLSNEALADLYRKAHVYCMPSTYEGFGLPYLEALASGTLAVSTPNPGANEVLQNGKYGVVVPDSQLADAIADALLNYGDYKDKIADGLQRASDCSWENVVPHYLSYGRRQ
ncbi:glycosyltransferase family 4 protein [Paenibacillus sp. NEAU-GSW1]|uniref:glycosyltransferase family 4 protein n=1 Tax=Paenibacillus sp. NEAU-GSW1 TaxID=2682486 RepID=UPI0012E25CDC|nr:glycosyltransferase family 4 protein [Paenibacillus sp. NEAU-GSW1]MUT68050.1 glycosyltransferase [Paenibacillus sp. NEAU-GSW1]